MGQQRDRDAMAPPRRAYVGDLGFLLLGGLPVVGGLALARPRSG